MWKYQCKSTCGYLHRKNVSGRPLIWLYPRNSILAFSVDEEGKPVSINKIKVRNTEAKDSFSIPLRYF